ncbi:MAG: S-DNA-T family DNA segregation ATPase FtsK/SpoIIIE [Sphingobacteriales bacterium]|jgi:S-DNA-T family DNA segregation ATPase FtsK/SpoIIIE
MPTGNKFKSSKKQPASKINLKLGSFKNEKFTKILGLFCILLSVILCVSFVSYLFTGKADFDVVKEVDGSLLANVEANKVENWLGSMGAWLSHLFLYRWFGISSFVVVYLLSIFGLRLLIDFKIHPISKSIFYGAFTLFFTSIFFGFFENAIPSIPDYLSGNFGVVINNWFNSFIGVIGTGVFILFVLFSFLVVAFNLDFKKLGIPNFIGTDTNKELTSEYDEELALTPEEEKESVDGIELTTEKNPDEFTKSLEIENGLEEDDFEEVVKVEKLIEEKTDEIPELEIELEETVKEEEVTSDSVVAEYGEYDPKLDLSNYKHPTVDLLDEYGKDKIKVSQEELEENKNKIVETLGHYKIDIAKIKATIGPTVTLYEIVPAAGVRISKIKNLEDDIALSLAALGIRIIAPIPGKGTIGIEVPNQNPEIVGLKSVLATEKFKISKMDLPIALGKTISNEVFITDLAKMPHLLIAGATGQGKSVGINTLLLSLIYKKHPSQLKLVLVDPKKVELSIYKKIERHFLAKLPGEDEAIITDTNKVVATLNSLCIEMDTRYNLLKDASVRNLKEYNAKFVNRKLNPTEGHRYMPFIVLVVDEFADMMMTAGKEVETPIARLAQLARAVGIHLVIATQRPSVNIITGTIKANFPARIAFRVTSKIDSRTILDSGGADQLIGRGDMLFSDGNDLIRLQCAFVDTHEVEEIVSYVGGQQGYSDAFLLPEYIDESASTSPGQVDLKDKDMMFRDAAIVVVQNQQGSTSLIQRKLKIGYNRAGRIIDQLEAAGIVGNFEGSKARDVLIPDEHSLELHLTQLEESLN